MRCPAKTKLYAIKESKRKSAMLFKYNSMQCMDANKQCPAKMQCDVMDGNLL